MWYLIVSIPDLCPLSYFVLPMRIPTPVSFLVNEFDVQSVMHGQVSLGAINQICVNEEALNACKTLKVH